VVAAGVMVTPQHPTPKHERRDLAGHECDWRPLAGPVPSATGDERVHVRMPGEVVTERLRHGDHARQERLAVG
jgi:hypothetical protein